MKKRGSLQARVVEKKRLAQMSPQAEGLGAETIMDRALAQEHGVPYVHLAVFCIDVDRAYQVAPDDSPLPFGWEVFLTQCYIASALQTRGDDDDDDAAGDRELLESACLHVLDGDPAAASLGSQLTFAVHDGLSRGLVSELLRPVFRTWRGGTRQLSRELDPLWQDAQDTLQRIALHCLTLPLSPAWAPPSLEVLQRMAAGELPLPLDANAGDDPPA